MRAVRRKFLFFISFRSLPRVPILVYSTPADDRKRSPSLISTHTQTQHHRRRTTHLLRCMCVCVSGIYYKNDIRQRDSLWHRRVCLRVRVVRARRRVRFERVRARRPPTGTENRFVPRPPWRRAARQCQQSVTLRPPPTNGLAFVRNIHSHAT